MEHYTVYWPLDVINDLKSAGDQGPIKVVYGSIHSRMPSIVSIKEGDIVYPVNIFHKQLYVMARLPVEHRECAFDYLLRELGQQYGALIPDGFALECQDIAGKIYYWTNECKSYNTPADVPKGMQIIYLDEQIEKPHQEHQEPFNCCSEYAVWGTKGSLISPRLFPAELISKLRFGPKGKERPLILQEDGSILPQSLKVTRRMTKKTAKLFEELFQSNTP